MSKQVKLENSDKTAQVDDIDYDFITQWKWILEDGYAVRYEQGSDRRKKIYMHKVIANRARILLHSVAREQAMN